MTYVKNGKRPFSPDCKNKLCAGYMGTHKTMKRIYLRDNGIPISIGWICIQCGSGHIDNAGFIEGKTEEEIKNLSYDLFPKISKLENTHKDTGIISLNKTQLLFELKIIKKLVNDIPEKRNNKAIDKTKCIEYIKKYIKHIKEL